MIVAMQAFAEEPQQAKTAFENYVASLEARVDAQNASRDAFLWIDQDPQRLAAVRNGEIQTQQIQAPQN